VAPEELEQLPLPTLHAIEILEFVPLQDVDPVFFERGYYVGPGEGGARAFALLRAVLAEAGRAALTKVALRAKESLGLLRVAGPALALETMYYPDEVRPVAEVEDLPEAGPVDPRELAMARELVARLSGPFVPERYHDNYRLALRELLGRKAAGRDVVRPAAAPETPGFEDLLAALRASVRAAEARAAARDGEGSTGREPAEVGGWGARAGAGGHPGPDDARGGGGPDADATAAAPGTWGRRGPR
jgi:DNA end-binding protein Ku